MQSIKGEKGHALDQSLVSPKGSIYSTAPLTLWLNETNVDWRFQRPQNKPRLLRVLLALPRQIKSDLTPEFDRYSPPGKLPYLEMWASQESLAVQNGDVSQVPPIAEDVCEESFTLIRDWLARCINEHRLCWRTISGSDIDESIEPQLPTRVLDVGQRPFTDSVHLVESGNRQGHYVALSHCWGAREKWCLRTTPDTLAQHLSGIPVSTMPKTFREAVILTRVLGIRYLWIDSVCIIQGDKGDWQHEAGKMGEVYERARLTIAATSARDSSEGLFLSGRQPSDPVVSLPYMPDGETVKGEVFFKCGLPPKNDSYDVLSTRAWAFQEKHLSRRLLQCGKRGFGWQCSSCIHDPEQVITTYERDRKEHGYNRLNQWIRAIREYSAGSLTYETDRLIALEGLAKEVQKTRPGTYYYGHWTNSFLESLMWTPNGVLPTRNNPNNFPSWCWASAGSRIAFVENSKSSTECKQGTQPWRLDYHELPSRVLVCVYKEVKGEIKVRSQLRLANCSLKRYGSGTEGRQYWSDNFGSGGPLFEVVDRGVIPVGQACFDKGHEESLVCMLLQSIRLGNCPDHQSSHGFSHSWVLLLKKVRSRTYRRIGSGVITDKMFFEGEEMQDVILV